MWCIAFFWILLKLHNDTDDSWVVRFSWTRLCQFLSKSGVLDETLFTIDKFAVWHIQCMTLGGQSLSHVCMHGTSKYIGTQNPKSKQENPPLSEPPLMSWHLERRYAEMTSLWDRCRSLRWTGWRSNRARLPGSSLIWHYLEIIHDLYEIRMSLRAYLYFNFHGWLHLSESWHISKISLIHPRDSFS